MRLSGKSKVGSQEAKNDLKESNQEKDNWIGVSW